MNEVRGSDAPFACVGSDKYGYNVKQVDRFLARAREHYSSGDFVGPEPGSHEVRAMAFDAVRGGYEAREVDAALDRIEDVFAQRERDQLIEEKGEDAWLRRIGKISAVLRARLHRADTERFRRPKKNHVRSYDVVEVDGLCHQLLEYFEEDRSLSVDMVRRVVFQPAEGRAGYEETQVDAFLDRVVELMAEIH